MTRGLAVASLALVSLALLGACGDQSTFALGLDLEICESNLPTACGVPARCVLDQSHYLSGTFPGSRRFIARTDGEATIQFQLLLTEERAPGTELQLIAHEPSCGDRASYDSGGEDIFRLAGTNGVLSIPLSVHQPGDHLIELVADAYCDYALKFTL